MCAPETLCAGRVPGLSQDRFAEPAGHSQARRQHPGQGREERGSALLGGHQEVRQGHQGVQLYRMPVLALMQPAGSVCHARGAQWRRHHVANCDQMPVVSAGLLPGGGIQLQRQVNSKQGAVHHQVSGSG